MSLPDTRLRDELRQLVSEAGRRSEETETRYGFAAFLLAVAATVGAVGLGIAYSLSWWLLIIIGLVAFVVFVLLPYVFDSSPGQKHVERAAERFRELFTRESGDYDRALALLKGAKSDSEVEAELLKALGFDVTFADEGATELLGAFDQADATKTAAETEPAEPPESDAPREPAISQGQNFIPLDPYRGPEATAENPCGPTQSDGRQDGELTNKQ